MKKSYLLDGILDYVQRHNIHYAQDPSFIKELKELCILFEACGGLTKHFLKEFQNPDAMQERIAEMVFARRLKCQGTNFQIIEDSPDFFLPDENLWIEIVCPKPAGLPEDFCSPIELYAHTSYRIPTDEILLRWTAAINAKIEKLSAYKKSNIVTERQGYIIAVNCSQLGNLPHLCGASQYPYVVEVSYGIGPLTAYFCKDDSTRDVIFNPFQNHVKKPNNSAMVETTILLNRANKDVTAIIGANAGIKKGLRPKWEQYVIAHNPYALHPVRFGLIEGSTEYEAKINSDSYIVRLRET